MGEFGLNLHGYMASEPPSPSGHGPEPLRVPAMSNFTNTGLIQVRIAVNLLFSIAEGLLQLVVEMGTRYVPEVVADYGKPTLG